MHNHELHVAKPCVLKWIWPLSPYSCSRVQFHLPGKLLLWNACRDTCPPDAHCYWRNGETHVQFCALHNHMDFVEHLTDTLTSTLPTPIS